jgi:hypothetical protein
MSDLDSVDVRQEIDDIRRRETELLRSRLHHPPKDENDDRAISAAISKATVAGARAMAAAFAVQDVWRFRDEDGTTREFHGRLFDAGVGGDGSDGGIYDPWLDWRCRSGQPDDITSDDVDD